MQVLRSCNLNGCNLCNLETYNKVPSIPLHFFLISSFYGLVGCASFTWLHIINCRYTYNAIDAFWCCSSSYLFLIILSLCVVGCYGELSVHLLMFSFIIIHTTHIICISILYIYLLSMMNFCILYFIFYFNVCEVVVM